MYDFTVPRAVTDGIASFCAPDHGMEASSLSCLDGLGPVQRFESALRDIIGAEHVLAVASGAAALHTALLACDIGPGDEVIVSPYGWGQTVAVVMHVGATPVFADIDPISGNLDPKAVEEVMSNRTRAVLVTHMFGLPADMTALERICARHGVRLVSDAAQALGASHRDRPVGAWGDVACFSFGRGKLLTTGEGGAVATSDPELFERMILVSQHPLRGLIELEDPVARSSISEFTLSYRMSALAAVIGLEQVALLGSRVVEVRRRAALVADRLRATGLILPGDHGGSCHVFHTYVVLNQGTADQRRRIIGELGEMGIAAAPGPVRLPLSRRFPFAPGVRGWFPRALLAATRPWRQGSIVHAERRCDREEIMIDLWHGDNEDVTTREQEGHDV